MRLLLFALIVAVVLAGATWLARTTRLGQRTATRQVAILITAACTGLLLAGVLAWVFGLEFDSAMLATLGVFFLSMGWWYTGRIDAAPVNRKPLLPRLALGAIGAVLVVTAWRRSEGIAVAIPHCRSQYASARSATDTMAIDSVIPPGSPPPIGKYGRTMTCGRYRSQQFGP